MRQPGPEAKRKTSLADGLELLNALRSTQLVLAEPKSYKAA